MKIIKTTFFCLALAISFTSLSSGGGLSCGEYLDTCWDNAEAGAGSAEAAVKESCIHNYWKCVYAPQ